MSLQKYVRQVRPRTESHISHVDRVQDLFITEASFAMVNFPNDVGGDKPQAATRTVYPPVDGEDYAYPEGFPTLKSTDLVDKNGKVIKSLSANKTVLFTAPATLHKLTGSSWFAKVSLKAYDKPFDGYIMISHVKKPGGKSQKRVAAGTKTQEECAAYIKELCLEKDIEFESDFTVAKSGSTIPDLVMTIGGKRIQFEIKGTNARKNEITFFDITARRKQNAKSKVGKIELDKTTEFYINSVPELKNVFKKLGNTWDKIRKKSGDEGGAFHAVMEYSKSLGAEVVKRSDGFCDEISKTPNDMIKDMCLKVDTDIILWAHCTNPFVDEQIYNDALNMFLKRDIKINDSLLSVVELKTHLWHKVDNALVPMNYDPYGKTHPLAKTLEPIYYQDGAIFIQPHKQMLKNSYFFGRNPIHYIMSENQALDINTNYDYKVAKSIAEWENKEFM